VAHVCFRFISGVELVGPGRLTTTMKGYSMWALVIFTIATTGVASSTVTSIEFATQHLWTT